MASPNPTHHFFEGLGEKTDDISFFEGSNMPQAGKNNYFPRF